MDWIPLKTHNDLETIDAASQDADVFIFKHSTTCGISRFVLKDFQRDLGKVDLSKHKFYLLDLLKYRSISNAISTRYKVTHQSPQLLRIRKGAAIYHSSHSSISVSAISA